MVFHIDMDSYFASVEQQARPYLRGKPIVVSGRPDIFSVVAAASKEAKRYGIRSGMTTWEAQKLCPHVIFVPGDPEKYETLTRRFLDILIRYTPMVELYSIDEVFLEASQTPRYGGPLALARAIQQDFRQELGECLTCSIGLAPNKLLAKLASEKAKPGGIHWIRPDQVPAVLAHTPVEAVTGIGPRIAKRLAHMGIWTLADLGRFPEPYLRRVFGVYGAVLALWGRGVDPTPVRPYWQEEEVKSVGHSHALPHGLRHPEGARAVLLYLCEKTARRLRAKGLAGRVVHYALRDEHMGFSTAQHALDSPTDNADTIFQTALDLIHAHGGFPPQTTLVGVRVGALQPQKEAPRPLFPQDQRRERLQQALDRIRDRYGEEAILRGTTYTCQVLVGATGGMGKQKEIALARKGADR